MYTDGLMDKFPNHFTIRSLTGEITDKNLMFFITILKEEGKRKRKME